MCGRAERTEGADLLGVFAHRIGELGAFGLRNLRYQDDSSIQRLVSDSLPLPLA